MHRRAVLYLCAGGRASTTIRCTDRLVRGFAFGSVYCSKKSPPDSNDAAATPAQEKTDVPHQEDSSDSSEKLLNLLRGMKVRVSSEQTFQNVQKKKAEVKKQAAMEEILSASRMFQMASGDGHPMEEKAVSPELEAAASAGASTSPHKKYKAESALQQQLRLHKQMAKGQREGNLDIREKAVSPELEAAASAVASTFPHKKDTVKSELLQQLRLHKQMTEEQREGNIDIRNVLSGMKVTKYLQKPSQRIQHGDDQKAGILWDRKISSKNLYRGERLNIFPVPSISEETAISESSPNLWDIELAKAIASVLEQPLRNGFEEMIEWTKEGKLWTFPIDNEAGLDEEQKVEFHEHIFLEKYLEDFAKDEAIQHFMELVICGLSKNPYLTVLQKREHIDWFRNYFTQKQDLLRESDVQLQ